MVKAIYAFSGDPITNGHINIIQRASHLFDELVVGIGVNPEKRYIFSLDERKGMAERVLQYIPNVTVTSYDGMLVRFAYEQGIDVVVRGIRSARDFNYEWDFAQAGSTQQYGIETVPLFADQRLANIASSTAKEIVRNQGLVHEYVPLYVKQCMEARLLGQYIVGVTGEIGSGKSYVSDRFVELGMHDGLEVHNLDLDKIAHIILGLSDKPVYINTRKLIAETFGDDIVKPDGSINRKALGAKVFGDIALMAELNQIMELPILNELLEQMRSKRGLLLLNGALLAEAKMTYLSNNNVVLVNVNIDIQRACLEKRGLNETQIKTRLESQFNSAEKRVTIEEMIQAKHNGILWRLDNSEDGNMEEIKRVYNRIITELGVK